MEKPWTYEYEEMGGYDNMTGAFQIFHKGIQIATIDQHDFGQEPYSSVKLLEPEGWARFIVDACNNFTKEKS